MLYEGQYNIIPLYSASKGMNQEIAPELISQDYSYYIENIMPTTLGEGQVRFGTANFSTAPQDNIIEAFSFQAPNGKQQQVLYMNGFNPIEITSFDNLRIISSNQIQLTNANYALFQQDSYLQLQYQTPSGISQIATYEILSVTSNGGNTITIEVNYNTFPTALQNYFVLCPTSFAPVYISATQFSISVPDDFISNIYFSVGQSLKLSVNDDVTQLTISAINTSVPGTITFTCSGTAVPAFGGGDTVTLSYQSLTPNITSIANSFGYIKVLDVASNELLTGGNQTLTNLSVTCVPRAEFFAGKLWIYNGVDPNMTWDGTTLEVYTELVKEAAQTFEYVDTTHFTFTAESSFKISKYQNNNTIYLGIIGGANVTTTVVNVSIAGDIVTIQTAANIPAFTGANRVELFYTDQPPPFSFMKAAIDRLWCLGTGAVGLDYRTPDQALRVYYTYNAYSGFAAPFKFFNENTKTVPSIDLSPKHGSADNLEAIMVVSNYLAFVGRQKTQIWKGNDPLTITASNSFTWVATLPVGIFHGNLIVELANDAYFLSQNGFLSYSTFNIARQLGATTTNQMDKVALEYINSIKTNIQYRACRAFKYNNGAFCGFKIGQNNVIVSRFHTSLYWWGIFSGDFAKATTFLSNINQPLFIYIGKTVFTYGDGANGVYSYGDNGGTALINFSETKYVNNLKARYANKRYEIQCNYSSNVVLDSSNTINLYISGDLRTTFTQADLYSLAMKGDVLGTINLADDSKVPSGKNPPKTLPGMRLDSPSQTTKGRLKFVSSVFSVTLVGAIKDGPFSLKKIRLFGFSER